MMQLTQEQYNGLKAALLMAIGGERDERVRVSGRKYSVDSGDSYIVDPPRAGVYRALEILDAATPERPGLVYDDDLDALEILTVDELRELAERRDIELQASYVNKAALIDIIRRGKQE